MCATSRCNYSCTDLCKLITCRSSDVKSRELEPGAAFIAASPRPGKEQVPSRLATQSENVLRVRHLERVIEICNVEHPAGSRRPIVVSQGKHINASSAERLVLQTDRASALEVRNIVVTCT